MNQNKILKVHFTKGGAPDDQIDDQVEIIYKSSQNSSKDMNIYLSLNVPSTSAARCRIKSFPLLVSASEIDSNSFEHRNSCSDGRHRSHFSKQITYKHKFKYDRNFQLPCSHSESGQSKNNVQLNLYFPIREEDDYLGSRNKKEFSIDYAYLNDE